MTDLSPVYTKCRTPSIKTFQDLTDSVNACADRGTVPGSRGGGNAREVQAESVKDAINFLKSN
ncbi:MAG: hypothetical protein HEQ17_01250 [Limnohabitans sp.]|jgi:hypothetical protein|uniref:hypothetical protein n=1 Tax=Limnohabitans sp. TaxID=1907725 RepID=UPI0025E6D0B0|nr:hypothetical protein [Limnohabitans sp.]MCO4087629.1 hypothetical protein [Limnohabitans sp.]